MAEGALAFDCRVVVRIRIPAAEQEVFDGLVELVGRFVAVAEVDAARASRFASASALYLLWPYARAILDEAARRSGVEAPPLPLLVRPQPGGLILPPRDD